MVKHTHEFRDPIHVFIRLETDERRVVDSRAFQRLRHVHQLALTYLLYPGATHRRFEHSLGVMELATRVYDVITREENLVDAVRDVPPKGGFEPAYWRRVLRMAALCHDIGHLPFSHAAERQLLPSGTTHEDLTLELITSDELKPVWEKLRVTAEHVAKIAVGPGKHKGPFNNWEAILSEIIVGDAFGVDRIDYLLRDSLHAGVAYGRFDHSRLIDCLRILPKDDQDESREPTLGITEGGLHSAEALLLARYFMYMQLYLHPVRRVYDIHLRDFLHSWLPNGKFPVGVDDHIRLTDNEVWAAILEAARRQEATGHAHADRIVNRRHFKILYSRDPEDIKKTPEPAREIFDACVAEFGADNLRLDSYKQKGGAPDFPVICRNGRVRSSLLLSSTLENIPVAAIDFIFVHPEIKQAATKWLKEHQQEILGPETLSRRDSNERDREECLAVEPH